MSKNQVPPFVKAMQVAATSTANAAREAFGPAQVPSPDQRVGNYITKAFTYTTVAGGDIRKLYDANIPWAKVKLLLQTAGPVAVGTVQQITPVLSGKGILLQTGVWTDITLAKGNILYIASPTVNRISVIIEPLPWLEQILGGIVQGFDLLFRKGK